MPLNEAYEPMSSVVDTPAHGLALNASVWFFAGQLDDSEQVRHVPIRTMPFQIGRRSDLSLSLPCNCVSKVHAEIYEKGDELWIRDLSSTNGTYVNGARIETDVRLREGDIVQFATVVFRIGCQNEDGEEEEMESGTITEDACDRALAMVQFDRLINDQAVVPFFQPIVDISSDQPPTVGYEVLGRSRLFGLRTPKEMFETASQLNLEAELSRVFRHQGIKVASPVAQQYSLFVNTHPVELLKDGLLGSLKDIREIAPDRSMTLEIHEATVTNPQMIRDLRDNLNDLDMQLAFDDFGAGQARLLELTEVRPDFIKFDMKLIQGINHAPANRQQVVALLVRMVNELGIIAIAEGVETPEENKTLQQMGFKMGQGYLYGRPASISSYLPTA